MQLSWVGLTYSIFEKENTKQESKECVTAKIQGPRECIESVCHLNDAPRNCDVRNGDVPRMLDNDLNNLKSSNRTYAAAQES